jgi:hypothetical protein
VSVVVTGRFSAPDFRDEDGILRPDESGAMTVRSHQWRDFYLAFPAEGAAEPFPLATVEHGLNSYKETMYAWVRALAARGIASASFDFMYHAAGKRGGFQFMAVDAPRKAADNIRQSALDILSFEKALRRLSEERDLYPIGGDGKPDLAPERVAYTGHSLGAIVSSLTCPISSGARVAGMANGGGDYVHVFTMAFTKLGMIDLLPGDTVCAFDVLGSHIMSVADPVVLARRMSADPDPDHGPCPFLLLVSLEDMTVPGRCGYEYTVAAGTPVIEPLVEPWEYTTSSPAAATLSGTIQFHGGHELINGGDGPELEAQAQEVLFHYLESFLETGTPQIVWPAGE